MAIASEKTPDPTQSPTATPTQAPKVPTPVVTPETKKQEQEFKVVKGTPAPSEMPESVTPKPSVLTPPPNPGTNGEGTHSGNDAPLEPPKGEIRNGTDPAGSLNGLSPEGSGSGVQGGSGGGQGETGIALDGGNFPPDYIAQIETLLKSNFTPPAYLRENKTCTVRFKILQDGSLRDPQVVEGQGTGFDGLNLIAIQAVEKARRVFPYPPEYSTKPFVYARVNFQFTPANQ